MFSVKEFFNDVTYVYALLYILDRRTCRSFYLGFGKLRQARQAGA